MSQVYRVYEIKEEHELEFFFRSFECPHCICGSVHHDNAEVNGMDFWEDCEECGGHGILYLDDCRPCEYCGKKIYFKEVGGRWLPFLAETDEQDFCPQFK